MSTVEENGSTKVAKQFVYEGLGFPVVLRNIKMMKSRGIWIPDVNFNHLQDEIAKNIAKHLHCITGNQLKFLRLYLGYTRLGLARKVGVHPSQITRWERHKTDEIIMDMKSRSKVMKFFRAEILNIYDKTGYEYDDTILIEKEN